MGYPPLRGWYPRGPQPCATRRSKLPACDLHALGTSPAFVLSQDQTLRWVWSRPEGRGITPKREPTYIITIQLFRCAMRLKANKKPGGGLPLHPGDVSGFAGAVRVVPSRASVVEVCLQRSETVNTLVV